MRRFFSRSGPYVVLLLAACAPGLPAAETPAAPPNAQAVKDLIAQLESSDVDARERATQALVDAGPNAGAALAQAAEWAGPETRTRIEKIRLGWEIAREQAAKEAWKARFKGLAPGKEMIHEVYETIAAAIGQMPEAHTDSSSADRPLECTESHALDDDWRLRVAYRREAIDKPWKLREWSIGGFPDLRPRMRPAVYPLVRAIHRSSDFSGDAFDPRRLLRAANHLQAAGKVRACEALQTYIELSREGVLRPYAFDDDRTFGLTRLLFVPSTDDKPLRPPCLGMPDVPSGSGAQFPLVLSGGVPFMVVGGYTLAGKAESPGSYLEYCAANGSFRAARIVPELSPLDAAEALWGSAQWSQTFTDDGKKQDDSRHRAMVRAQALRALGQGAPKGVDPSDEKSWADAVRKVKALRVRWDPKEGRFVMETPP